MFDIGFFELVVVGVVALLVIGPERLPETLRTLALWWGRLKRAMQSTRTELEQQLGADDIRRQLHNEEIMQRLNSTKEDIARAVNENVQDIQSNLRPGDSAPAVDNTLASPAATAREPAPAVSDKPDAAINKKPADAGQP